MVKLTPEIKGFIDSELSSSRPLKYSKLKQRIAQKYGLRVSKATISKRAKALKIQFRRGRKPAVSVERKPAHSVFLDCAGAFFLKGAELEMGLLTTINQLLKTSAESVRARKALKLAQQINAILLYAPVFELKTTQEIAAYTRKGLLYLSGQKGLLIPSHARQGNMPRQGEIEQYLRFLTDHKLLLFIIKEVAKACSEALFVRIDSIGQKFYLDAQARTVWPSPKVPIYFSATLSKTSSCVESTFQSPSTRRPLIMQVCPGYTFLPKEMFDLIQCFEQAQKEPISRIVIAAESGKILKTWQDVKPGQKCYFIAPLSPWQYARLQGTRIVKNFRQYLIGPEKEPMEVAEAQINLFNSQLNANIKVRAALVRRKEERLALITNISQREERYIRKIAEHYFCRWPDSKLKTYYDLLEQAHAEELTRAQSRATITSLLTKSYGKIPLDGFRLLLEHVSRYAASRFFPSEYSKEDLKSMKEKFYHHQGYLKIRQNLWEIVLQPFGQKKLQKDVQIACQGFNQSGIEFPDHTRVRISLQQQQ